MWPRAGGVHSTGIPTWLWTGVGPADSAPDRSMSLAVAATCSVKKPQRPRGQWSRTGWRLRCPLQPLDGDVALSCALPRASSLWNDDAPVPPGVLGTACLRPEPLTCRCLQLGSPAGPRAPGGEAAVGASPCRRLSVAWQGAEGNTPGIGIGAVGSICRVRGSPALTWMRGQPHVCPGTGPAALLV